MSNVQKLRSFVNQRLTAAAEEIFDLFERTATEYQEQVCRLKEENERQRKLLDALFNPDVDLSRPEVQQLLVRKDGAPFPVQQERGSGLNDRVRAEPPKIKQEEEDLWALKEGESLQEPEEEEINMFTVSPVYVKTEEEDEEEEPQSSQLHQTQTVQTDHAGAGSGAPRPFYPVIHLKHPSRSVPLPLSESETDDSNSVWDETWEPQSGFNKQTKKQKTDASVSDMACNTASGSSSEHDTGSGQKKVMQEHKGIQTGDKPFNCLVCDKKYPSRRNLQMHMLRHSVEKPFSCSVCQKTFISRGEMAAHMRVHTGERPFSCEFCGKSFSNHGNLRQHTLIHTGEKPFSCEVCGKKFTWLVSVRRHQSACTGGKRTRTRKTAAPQPRKTPEPQPCPM